MTVAPAPILAIPVACARGILLPAFPALGAWVAYSKPWLSYADQLTRLKARGLIVSDDAMALEYLRRIGYYRLTAYWHPMLERAPYSPLTHHSLKPEKPKVQTRAIDAFRPGATFQRALDLYVFDKRLRMLALDAMERIEVALRVDISHTLGRLHRFACEDPKFFRPVFGLEVDPHRGTTPLQDWRARQSNLIDRSNEEFVAHNKNKYGLPLAIWVACEVWDFGALVTLFRGMREDEQNTIANRYGLSKGATLASWLRSLNYLRNLCAHHARVWNRAMVDAPSFPSASDADWVVAYEKQEFRDKGRIDEGEVQRLRHRCFAHFFVMNHLMKVINPKSTWRKKFEELMDAFPTAPFVEISHERMGAPKNWKAYW